MCKSSVIIFLLCLFVANSGFTISKPSSAPPPPPAASVDPDDDPADEDSDPLSALSSNSSDSEVEYEKLAAGPGAAVLVRKDGLTSLTIFTINKNYALYGTLPNPLNEREAKALRNEVSAAQFYYAQNGGVSTIPKELKDLLNRANTLYQNTSNTNRPPVLPASKLPPELKKGVCDNVPYGMKDFYLAYCTN